MKTDDSAILHRRLNGSSRRSFLASLLLLFFLMLMTPPARAQVYSGSVAGAVTDPSGAVVPNAAVTLTDVAKGFPYATVTDSSGRYVLRNLAPGVYSLKVEAKGFTPYAQTGITLTVQQNATVDVALQLGATTAAVNVTAAAPLLAAEDAVTGQEVNRTFVDDLPLLGRSGYNLTLLAPGVVPIPTVISGFMSGGGNAFYSDGMRNMSSEIFVDGIPTSALVMGNKTQLYQPIIDDIQEFAVQSNNFSAEVGHSGSTTIVVVTRSGTNNFHGNAYDFLRNQVTDSNNWFGNASNIPIPPLRYNDFGGTIGGPIQKDKTFFFADYEGSRLRTFQNFLAGVPSAAERTGDFSELCGGTGGPAPGATFNAQGACSNPAGQLWDPYSGVYSSSLGGPVRGTFIPFNNMATYTSLPTLPGNAILVGTPLQRPLGAGNLIDPVASKIMAYYPLPNAGVGTASYNPYNNWRGSGVNVLDTNQFDVRIDRRISDKMQLNGKFGDNWSPQELAKAFNNPMEPFDTGPSSVGGTTIALNLTRNLSSNTLLSVTGGFTRGGWVTGNVAKEYPGYDPIKTLGLPSYLEDAGVASSPFFIIGDYAMAAPGLDSIGESGWSIANVQRNVWDLLASVDHVGGRHEVKVGGEYKVHQENYWAPNTPMGLFVMNRYGMSEYPASGGGDALATLLSGVDTSGSASYQGAIPLAQEEPMYGVFIQDKWRVTKNLTLNLGFRYDLEQAADERHNHQEYFDPSIASPLVVPGLPNLLGGDVFNTPSDRRWAPAYLHELQPRIGLAYRLTPTTVLRGGYGIFFNANMYGPGDTLGTDGYGPTTPWESTYNFNLATPGPPLSNPWPGGPILPFGSSQGALTNVGFTPDGFFRAWNKIGNTQTWNLGVQRQLRGGVLIEANYVANKGTNLPLGGFTNLNYLGPSVEKASATELTALESPVANPFYGIITNPTSGLSGPTVPQYQLDYRFPQFEGMYLVDGPFAGSNYQSFQLKFEKRFSQGLQFLASYTNSKSLDQGSADDPGNAHYGGWTHLADPNNLKLEWALSAFDVPQVLKLTYVYELPFGRGKPWGQAWNPWVNGFLGGWQTNGNWSFDDGFPIALNQSGGTPLPGYPSQQPNLLSALHKNLSSNENTWLQNYFTNPQVAVFSAPLTVGTAPPVIPNVRQPGTRNADLSLFKEIPLSQLREGAHLQFRVEAFNALNHPQFFGPNATVGSGSFGVVSAMRNSPRELQLALKLYW
jgi:hypothetical protein